MAGTSNCSGRVGESIVEDHGVHKTTCGYCRSKSRTSIAHGLVAYTITVDDYQDLLDRGWRRSGKYLYKPEMEKTCCPPYTIRLKVDSFVPSKEQKRVQRRMQRYLEGAYSGRKTVTDTEDESKVVAKPLEESLMENNISSRIDDAVKACVDSKELPPYINYTSASVKKVTVGMKRKLKSVSKNLMYTSNIAFQIAALLRQCKSIDSVNDTQKTLILENSSKTSSQGFSPTVISEKLASKLENDEGLSRFFVQSCNGHLNFNSNTSEEELSLSITGEHSADNDSMKVFSTLKQVNCKGDRMHQEDDHFQQPTRKLEIRTKKSTFDPDEFALYKKYQISVHGDKPSEVKESSYKRFLVDTPLVYVPPGTDGSTPPDGFGSFHQQYWIDGQLIAVGVVDILPRCLSSKYLFWDPDLAFLSLGKYSALQEISWIQEAQKHCPTLQYYYLGYYIHSCPKMRYKAAYNPSELLCPLRYQWVPFQVAKPFLDRSAYVCLSECDKESETDLHSISNEGSDSCLKEEREMKDIEMHDEAFIDYQNSSSSDESMDPGIDVENQVDMEELNSAVLEWVDFRFRYKDIESFGLKDPQWLNILAGQLRKYIRIVGRDLSQRIVYQLA